MTFVAAVMAAILRCTQAAENFFFHSLMFDCANKFWHKCRGGCCGGLFATLCTAPYTVVLN